MAKLLSSLANGSLVKFGKHQVNTETAQPIVWMVVAKNHSGYPSNSVTLMTQKIIDLRSYDAKCKDGTYDSYYKESNIAQWLNSDASAGNWYARKDTNDNPPSGDSNNVNRGTQYQNKAGFLSNFTSEEKLALLPTTLTLLPPAGGTEDISAKVFIPSIREILGEPSNLSGDKSTRFSYMSTAGSACKLTSQAYTNTLSTYKPTTVDDNWWYMTRSRSQTNIYIVDSTGVYNTSKYGYEGSLGVRPVINLSSNTKVSDTADSDGCYTVKFNNAPVIDGSNKDLGSKSAGFTQTYNVTDVDADSVTVKEYIDNTLIRSHVVTLGTSYTISVTDATWLKLANGSHTIKIVANDGFVEATRTYTFTKNVTGFTVVKKVPYDSAAMPTQIRVSVVRSIPEGATFKVYACNNGYDTSPTWEEITAYVVSGDIYDFKNTTKIATKWGVNVKVTVERGTASGACYITEIGGNFE